MALPRTVMLEAMTSSAFVLVFPSAGDTPPLSSCKAISLAAGSGPSSEVNSDHLLKNWHLGELLPVSLSVVLFRAVFTFSYTVCTMHWFTDDNLVPSCYHQIVSCIKPDLFVLFLPRSLIHRSRYSQYLLNEWINEPPHSLGFSNRTYMQCKPAGQVSSYSTYNKK